MSTTTRQTAEVRREAVLEAAATEFSRKGIHGASTDAIAKAAGISQPYLFRLFGTKKELYLAATRLKMEEVYQAFERASRGKSGQEALHAMGEAYRTSDRGPGAAAADAAVLRRPPRTTRSARTCGESGATSSS